MKKKSEESETELLKAVAQAWHGHSGVPAVAPPTTSECSAHRRSFTHKPSRFRLEAIRAAAAAASGKDANTWDFKKSLWDSYEIVSVTNKLERGLAFDRQFTELNSLKIVAVKPKRVTLKDLFRGRPSKRLTVTASPLSDQ